MLDVPGYELLDKGQLLGGCLRLPLAIDAERLRREVEALPVECWVQRVGRHQAAQVTYLRGQAPAAGDHPVADNPLLERLPYARTLLHETLEAAPMRALLARLPAGGAIIPHRDQGPYFGKTIRLHVPVITNPEVWTYCAGRSYRMAPGEAWALNNSAVHGVWNAHPSSARVHLICDFLPAPALLQLLSRGDRSLGRHDGRVEAALAQSLAASPDYRPA